MVNTVLVCTCDPNLCADDPLTSSHLGWSSRPRDAGNLLPGAPREGASIRQSHSREANAMSIGFSWDFLRPSDWSCIWFILIFVIHAVWSLDILVLISTTDANLVRNRSIYLEIIAANAFFVIQLHHVSFLVAKTGWFSAWASWWSWIIPGSIVECQVQRHRRHDDCLRRSLFDECTILISSILSIQLDLRRDLVSEHPTHDLCQTILPEAKAFVCRALPSQISFTSKFFHIQSENFRFPCGGRCAL